MLKKIDAQITRLRQARKDILSLLNVDLEEYMADRPPFEDAKLRAKTLKELKVAAIMDGFTLECFKPECQLTELTPDGWKREMESAQPELLFLESAWQGKDGLWAGKVNHCTQEIYDLTEYCHEHKIPVIFWNKEDPVYTDVFMQTARRADVVFTTEIECIEKYKTELGHDQVYHLHFAAQPLVHNPIEKYERKDKFCFAGAYYHRYVQRCKTFDAFADYFFENRGLDIYDRNYQNARPEHKFPERYDPYILGKLAPSEIDVAYKGYNFGINMNSCPQAQTMFARRVFELMASNTIVVGNYARGVKNYFGDLTFCTDDAKTLKLGLEQYCADENQVDKLRLLGLRKVLREHLCEDRMDEILQKVYGRSLKKALPSVGVYSRVETQQQADRVISMFRNQEYDKKSLILVSDGQLNVPAGIQTVTAQAFDEQPVEKLIQEDFAACFAADDWYGKNYLTDLVLTVRYGEFDLIGKAEYFSSQNSDARRQNKGKAYRPAKELASRRSMISRNLLSGKTGVQLTPEQLWQSEQGLAIDAMNYCENWQQEACPAAEDLVVADQGIPMETIRKAEQKINAVLPSLDCCKIGPDQIGAIRPGKTDALSLERQPKKVVLTSQMAENQHTYIYLPKSVEIEPLIKDGSLTVRFNGEGSLSTIGYCMFCDEQGKQLEAQAVNLSRRANLTPPAHAKTVKLAYRLRGAGVCSLHSIELGISENSSLRGGCFLSRSNVLVLTNHYPSADNLYNNMFVHKRLTDYKEQGHLVDVMVTNAYATEQLREFEGINIIEGLEDTLSAVLANGNINTVCVHFLTKEMWDVLKPYVGSIRLIIWSHGADIQPWWRREYLFDTPEKQENGKKQTEIRMHLWNEVFDAAEKEGSNIQLVFVSEFAKKIVEEDYKRSISAFSTIIPNLIDTDMFSYQPKKAEDRLNIVSIRPFASSVYANDLSVKAILALSEKPWFNELHFTIVGKGELFESTVHPLRKFANVELREEFLRQSQIVELYHKNGVVLIPSRSDTQGVSRDEAMSCGLVPVTSNVAAIPEFVDESCGILAPEENFEELAVGIERLYQNPELYLRMSENAAKRVRTQTSREFTTQKEADLIFETK